MRDAAIWLRVSRDSQDEINQLPDLERLCAQHDLRIVRRFVVHGESAWKGEHQATRAELLDAAYRGEFSVVVVWALDRISRQGIEDLLSLVRELRERHCTLMSHQEPWCNGSDAATELMLSIAAWMAKQESGRKSERIKAGMARAKREGNRNGTVGQDGTPRIGGRKAGSQDKHKRNPEPYRRAALRRHSA